MAAPFVTSIWLFDVRKRVLCPRTISIITVASPLLVTVDPTSQYSVKTKNSPNQRRSRGSKRNRQGAQVHQRQDPSNNSGSGYSVPYRQEIVCTNASIVDWNAKAQLNEKALYLTRRSVPLCRILGENPVGCWYRREGKGARSANVKKTQAQKQLFLGLLPLSIPSFEYDGVD